MTKVAVATTSQLAADAAAEVADSGGNAVDCAIAASLLAMNTQPGVCALAGGAYVTIWAPGSDPITIDGNVAVPGQGLPPGHIPGVESSYMEYGGGIETLVGAGSVAVPGSLAALEITSRKYGQVDWSTLLRPSIRAARDGFPLAAACHYYLEYSRQVVFGRSKDGYAALHNDDGSLKGCASNIVVPHLADSLEAIATEGSRIFYEGEIGARIAKHSRDNNGLLTATDLQNYVPIIREALRTDLGQWQIATNPAPAVGGAVLSAMLMAFNRTPVSAWSKDALRQMVEVQRAALSYRMDFLDLADDTSEAIGRFLELAKSKIALSRWASSSTVHTSAVDDDGLACAITASSGYGSGDMPEETGLWLNNCLGEIELNRHGLDAGPAGARLPSNMAPSVARNGEKVLAMGSPGAGRITTALLQFLINFAQVGLSLEDAVANPRMHVELGSDIDTLAIEPGLDLPDLDLRITSYPELNMYFGGVAAALHDQQSGFQLAADPRREGGICVAGR
jgi:gamma-glutamyltranspeptidase/glutathione hydrolase